METLSVRGLGLAVGGVFSALYVGCAFVMLTVPHEAALRLFNSMIHGVDVAPIMRWNTPWTEIVVGVLEVFIVGWLIGATTAWLYNLGARRK